MFLLYFVVAVENRQVLLGNGSIITMPHLIQQQEGRNTFANDNNNNNANSFDTIAPIAVTSSTTKAPVTTQWPLPTQKSGVIAS